MRQLHSKLVRMARMPAVTADTSDLITTICDMGDCQNATAIIAMDYTEAVTGVQFWTSNSDSCITSGTQQTATTNTVAVLIASDDSSLQAWSTATAAVTDLSLTSDTIAALGAADRLIAVELPNIRRYLACQFNGHGTTTTLGVTFIGRESQTGEAGSGARTAY